MEMEGMGMEKEGNGNGDGRNGNGEGRNGNGEGRNGNGDGRNGNGDGRNGNGNGADFSAVEHLMTYFSKSFLQQSVPLYHKCYPLLHQTVCPRQCDIEADMRTCGCP